MTESAGDFVFINAAKIWRFLNPGSYGEVLVHELVLVLDQYSNMWSFKLYEQQWKLFFTKGSHSIAPFKEYNVLYNKKKTVVLWIELMTSCATMHMTWTLKWCNFWNFFFYFDSFSSCWTVSHHLFFKIRWWNQLLVDGQLQLTDLLYIMQIFLQVSGNLTYE